MKLQLSFQKLEIYRKTPRAKVSQRKYISGRGNLSSYKPRSKEAAQKNIFYFVMLGFKAEKF